MMMKEVIELLIKDACNPLNKVDVLMDLILLIVFMKVQGLQELPFVLVFYI
jgi:hypothetical protein